MKKNRKISFISISSILTIAIVMSIFTYNISDRGVLNELKPNQEVALEGSIQKVEQTAEMMVEINSIDDLIKYSDNVIVGTVVDEEPVEQEKSFTLEMYKYVIRIDKNIKGIPESSLIDVYEQNSTLQIGKKYILFLGFFDTPLYPRPVYTSSEKNCIIEIDGNELKGRKKYVSGNLKYTDIIRILEKSEAVKFDNGNRTKYLVKEKYESTKDMVVASDYILEISVKEVTKYNKYAANIKAEITYQYKGNLPDQYSFILPSSMEIGKKYIILLKRLESGGLILVSREGSIISEDSTYLWDKFITDIKNN